jgi:O-antigen/teichoic acid export membrane protein
MFGIIGISDKFVPWFFGEEFMKSITVIKVLSPIIVLIAWSNVLGMQYLIPTGQNRAFTFTVTAGAVTNLLLNFFLIRRLQSVGATISTVLAEVFVTMLQFIIVSKRIKFTDFIDSRSHCYCNNYNYSDNDK